MTRYGLILTAAFAAVAAPAYAANFSETAGFQGSPCYALSNSGAFASGTVLDNSNDQFLGCHGGASVTIDTDAKTITLNAFEQGDYGYASIDITDISGLTITGLSAISWTSLFDPNGYGDGSTYGAIPTPQLSFTGNSLHIGFVAEGGAPPEFTFNPGGTAVFSYASGSVPEPASWALMLGGFGLVGGAMRRRKVAVSFG